MIIYKITNKNNGMMYIGQTTRSLKERIQEHVRHTETYIDRTMNKYGLDIFAIEIIDKAENIEELNQKEMYWIKYYNCINPKGYNLCEGGGVTLGFKHSEESKKKMSKVQKEKANQVGEKNHFWGKHHTREARDKMSKTRKGKKLTDETRKRMRMCRVNKRSVINITTGELFESISLAAERYNLHDSNISRACRSKSRKCGGYEWKYIDEVS